jgi:hypothetical protein
MLWAPQLLSLLINLKKDGMSNKKEWKCNAILSGVQKCSEDK